jgi:hypothetical protein
MKRWPPRSKSSFELEDGFGASEVVEVKDGAFDETGELSIPHDM